MAKKKLQKTIIEYAKYALLYVYGISNTYATYTVNTNIDIDILVGKLIGVILNIVRYAGAFVTLIGIYSFLSALKRDDADSKQNGITTALVGIALMGMKELLIGTGILV